jgi:hypothetical protein
VVTPLFGAESRQFLSAFFIFYKKLMKTKDIIKNIKNYLENDNFEAIDELLQEIYSQELSEEQEDKL